MTTSSDHPNPTPVRPSGDHWLELTATLSPKSTEQFGQWMLDDLEHLTRRLDRFETPNSRRQSGQR